MRAIRSVEPGVSNLDFSLFNNFCFAGEQLTAQFRGVISSTAVSPRQVQISVKVIF